MQIVGRLIYKQGWSGYEPQTHGFIPIRANLDASTSQRDIHVAIAILIDHHPGYFQRSAAIRTETGSHPLPTVDEWLVAVAISRQIANDTWSSVNRYRDVVRTMVTLFELGIVKSATRPHLAGNLVLIEPGAWINECYDSWFATCQIDPSQPFCRMPVREGGDWLYVDKLSLNAWAETALPSNSEDATSCERPADNPPTNGDDQPSDLP